VKSVSDSNRALLPVKSVIMFVFSPLSRRDTRGSRCSLGKSAFRGEAGRKNAHGSIPGRPTRSKTTPVYLSLIQY